MIIILDKCYEFMNKIKKITTEKCKISRLNSLVQLQKNVDLNNINMDNICIDPVKYMNLFF